jgi:hypothetical protein
MIEGGTHPVRDGFCVNSGTRLEENVGGNILREPSRRVLLTKGFAGPPEHSAGQNRPCRIANKRGNMRHGNLCHGVSRCVPHHSALPGAKFNPALGGRIVWRYLIAR